MCDKSEAIVLHRSYHLLKLYINKLLFKIELMQKQFL